MYHCQPVKSKYFENSVKMVLTSQKAWIVDRPRIVDLISSPILIPFIISHKLFPLFKPVTVNKIPWKTTNKSCFSHCWLIMVKDALLDMSHKWKTVATFIWRVMLISARGNSSSQPLSDSPGKVEELAESMPVILLFFLLKRKNRFMRKEWAPIQILEWLG